VAFITSLTDLKNNVTPQDKVNLASLKYSYTKMFILKRHYVLTIHAQVTETRDHSFNFIFNHFFFPRAHNTFAQQFFSFFGQNLVTLVQYDKVSTGRGFTHLHSAFIAL